MQTILGSGGAIGNELAKVLTKYTNNIRLVSRTPRPVNDSDKLFPADLQIRDEVMQAVEQSDIAYLTAGFEYTTSVWKNTWPRVMRNVIDACKAHNTKLVFFDNVYMYDKDYLNKMTEDTPVNPCSEKGKVRAEIAEMLLDEIANGSLTALITRSADFYGPNIKNTSILTETVFNNLAKRKKANWLLSLHHEHSFTYVPDAAKAMALLGNSDSAYNQVWHLPTARNPLTGKEWINAIAKEMNVEPKSLVLTMPLLNLLAFLLPIMKELKEMTYQYDRDYIFNSSKFEKQFNFKPTTYLDGIKEIIELQYQSKIEKK